MTRRAAIILAGGESRRFQLENENWQDKALAELFGKPLMIHAVESVHTAVDEVVVCVNDEIRKARYSKVLAKYGLENIRIFIDEKVGDLGGPIIAILTGLKSVNADYCLTLPCDTPLLQPKVANYLFEKAKGHRVVVPMWPDGRLETLMMICERSNIFEITDILCQLGRSRPDDIIRGASSVLFVSPTGELRDLDPDLKSFVNINVRNDLVQLQTRQIFGPAVENSSIMSPSLKPRELRLLHEASELQRKGEFVEASRVFSFCCDFLEDENLYFWAAIGRENEGRSLFEWSKRQVDPKSARKAAKRGETAVLKAAKNYALEAVTYDANSLPFLARRARDNKSWCELRACEKAELSI